MLQVFNTKIMQSFTQSSTDPVTSEAIPASATLLTIQNKNIAVEGFEATDTIETLDRDTYLSKRANSYIVGLQTEGKLYLAPEEIGVLNDAGYNLRKDHGNGVTSNAVHPGHDNRKYSRPIYLEPNVDGLKHRLYLRCHPKGGVNNIKTSKADYAKYEVDFDIFAVEFDNDVLTWIEADTYQALLDQFETIIQFTGEDFFVPVPNTGSGAFTPAS